MNDVKVDDVLRQIRALSQQAGFEVEPSGDIKNSPNFSALLFESIDKVNQAQQQAGESAKAFEAGDPSVNLSQVMVEMQKARVSFEALTQVRNKLISAYQEIMNMQI